MPAATGPEEADRQLEELERLQQLLKRVERRVDVVETRVRGLETSLVNAYIVTWDIPHEYGRLALRRYHRDGRLELDPKDRELVAAVKKAKNKFYESIRFLPAVKLGQSVLLAPSREVVKTIEEFWRRYVEPVARVLESKGYGTAVLDVIDVAMVPRHLLKLVERELRETRRLLDEVNERLEEYAEAWRRKKLRHQRAQLQRKLMFLEELLEELRSL